MLIFTFQQYCYTPSRVCAGEAGPNHRPFDLLFRVREILHSIKIFSIFVPRRARVLLWHAFC